MGCNTEQNEVGGKQLLLKVCSEALVGAVTSGDTSLTSTAHGAVVGDIVRFLDNGTNADVEIDNDKFYFVKTVETANAIEISETRGGAAINFTSAEAALSLEIFKSLGGIRSKSMSFSSEGIDITSQDSDEWNKILDGAGVRSFEFSGGGVYTNEEMFQDLRARAMANELVCLAVIDVKSNRIFEGCFKVTSLEISGDYDSESSYSMSATSSGEVQVVVPA